MNKWMGGRFQNQITEGAAKISEDALLEFLVTYISQINYMFSLHII